MVSVYETASIECRESQVMVGDSHESLRWSSFGQRLMFVLAALSQIVFVCTTAAEFTEQKASLTCFTLWSWCHIIVLSQPFLPSFAARYTSHTFQICFLFFLLSLTLIFVSERHIHIIIDNEMEYHGLFSTYVLCS